MRPLGLSRWIAIGAVCVLAAIVAVLSLAAYERSRPAAPTGTMAPAPTFDLGVQTPTMTPTPAADEISPDRRRLLSIGSAQWWRSTAGACGGPAPLIERSSDAGATWTDVTPNYLGVAQVQTLDAFSPADAEVVAATVGCNAQALRTYTRGEFWESYPNVLAASRFIDPKDAASVRLPTGPVQAPCDTASGLRAEGDVVALLCDEHAWSWTGSDWQQLAPEGAVALAIDRADVLVAHHADECAGIAVSRVATATPDTSSPIGCAEGADAAAPAAIDVAGGRVVMWSGDALVTIP